LAGFPIGHCRAIEPDQSHWQEMRMKWTAPKVVEISVGMEINCYACAEI
jgi:coenzyme PQQ precursor peptide PqqA